jgi:neutral ceramidase
MKRSPFALLVFFLPVSCAFAQTKAAPRQPLPPPAWQAGAASINITPPMNMWMAGYSARKKAAEGKSQELFAKALALRDEGGSRVVIVTTDLISIAPSLRATMEKRVQAAYQLGPESLLLNASHTHSGPEYRVAANSNVDAQRRRHAADYTAMLEEKLTTVVGEALQNLAPARLAWSHAKAGFAMNRRADYSLPAGHPYAGKAPNPDGPVDHEVPVLRVDAPDGTLRAIMFGYACHNTALLTYNYCGDYAGFAQEYLQEHRPGVIALFMMGAGGDQNPYPRRDGIVPGVSQLELTQQHGRSLANAVEVALSAKPRPVNGPLRAVYGEVALDYADKSRPSNSYPVQVLRFGDDLELVALGGEVVVDYSLRLKRELAGPAAVWIAAYSNWGGGYVPSLRVLREGGYEAEAGWAESVEERIVGKVHELRARLR